MRAAVYILIIMLIMVGLAWSQLEEYPPSVHSCVHATRKLGKRGDGTTRQSCMGCDPTYPVCALGCQDLIDRMYLRCDDVCLPNGYFFDPQSELLGCWEQNMRAIKIKVERCGCGAAFSSRPTMYFIALLLGIVSLWMCFS